MNCCGRIILALIPSILIMGCSEEKKTNEYVDRTSPYYAGPTEESYCSTVTTYASTATITGVANFQYRSPFGTLASGGLGAIESTPKPIRRAEVRAKNSGGQIVQCGETDTSGNFSLNLPANTGTYTVEVNSRALNDFAKVSVLNKPENNQFYSITATVDSSISTFMGTITASASTESNVIAGAFNILDQIVEANAYLKSKVGTGTCSGTGCTELNVAPKVSAYWVSGFNPGSYVDVTSGLSFYLPGYSRLFILGGLNGNTTESDTDHFDNSIILHEFGHFLEDQVFKSDSPGGSHDGQSVIDPRLAWSEGWGNFFQAAVRNSADYIDTEGNSDGSSTSLIFKADLENNVLNAYDNPKAGTGDNSKGYGTNGEGNFREFSVSRVLWDSIDTVDDSESINGGFSELWSVLTNQSWGWLASKWKFRSLGLFHKLQSGMTGGSDWSTIRTLEKQINTRQEYAQYITPDNSCADSGYYTYITPNSSASGSPNTDYFNNYDFYHLTLSSTGSGDLVIEWIDVDSSATKIDIDVRILDSDGRINNSNDIVAQNLDSNSSTSPSVAESLSLSLSSLPAGDYLVQVFSWNGTGTQARYNMKLNGVKLCQKDP